MLAVFRKDLRIFMRDRWALLFAVLVPVLVVTIIAEALFHSDGGPRLLVPVVNEDGGPVASTFMKLLALRDVLRDFLDTEALARLAAGKHLDGRSPEETAEFLRLFRELFIRTYVQRLLLFDAPDFAYGEERVTGDTATVSTEIVTPRDRFTVDYTFRHTQSGWRATDILVEQVSLAQNFRAQFDTALAKNSFQDLLALLRKKVDGAAAAS